jgi:transposase
MVVEAIRLTSEERRNLQVISRSEKERSGTRTRAMVVLLSDAGHSGEEVAEILGISRRTVCTARERWRRQAFDGLADAPRPGRPPRADAKYVQLMLASVERDPRAMGYAFTRWTAPRLVEYLYEKTGVRVTPAWLTELLRTHGFVWRRTKRSLKSLQDPGEMERARRRLGRLKKGRPPRAPTTSCGSGTGSTSISCPR